MVEDKGMTKWRRWAGMASLLVCAYLLGAVVAGVTGGWQQKREEE